MARKKLISVNSSFDDVWDTMEELTDRGQNVSEYACKAMRFYKKYKDSIESGITESRVREIFKEELQKHLTEFDIKPKEKKKLKIDDVLEDEDLQEAFRSFDSSIEKL